MKIHTISGFNEVGKNMTAVEVNNEVVIIDMGLHMEKIVSMTQEERTLPIEQLIKMGALPDMKPIEGKKVVGIVISHGHLDHLGAVPKLATKFRCPIYMSPYTSEILKLMIKDERADPSLINRIITIPLGGTHTISSNFEVELINVTHSIPDSTLVVLHTPDGPMVYLNDYKLDRTPTLGMVTDLNRIRKLGREGVRAIVIESLYAKEHSRCYSESIAKNMLRDTMNRCYEDNTAVFMTTFSSQIARLNEMIELNKDRREIIMMGRSLKLYTTAAKKLGYIDMSNIPVYTKRKDIYKMLNVVHENPSDYLVISTGNQAEHDAVLSRIARKEFDFTFNKGDYVVFSTKTIPYPLNIANKFILKKNLTELGARVIEDVHVSGHAHREDHRDMINMLNPEHIIPSHGETERLARLATLAMEEGYRINDTVHISSNGNVINIE